MTEISKKIQEPKDICISFGSFSYGIILKYRTYILGGGAGMKNMIEVRHLYKSFGDVAAVRDLSFLVREGELFAFLGTNGAGKSTTINMLCGQLSGDGGEIIINGRKLEENLREIQRTIGVVFQNSVLDGVLTVEENLRIRAGLYGIRGGDFEKRLEELADLLEFGDLRKRPLAKLSGGQRRRIDIARAILHRPKLLILDEPSAGLDPQTRLAFREAIGRLRREEDMTVFLTTHYMEEAADADYIVILEKGEILAEGTPLELKQTYAGDFVTLYQVPEEDVAVLGMKYEPVRDGYRLFLPNTASATQLIVEHQDLFRNYEVTKGSMDDVFLRVTGKGEVRDE